MDRALILADQILTLIRSSGLSQVEAGAALTAANAALTCAHDISFRNDLPEPGAQEDVHS
jgi:hypothetical protein